MFFYLLYHDIISLTSLKITYAFHLFLGFENQIVFRDFKFAVASIRLSKDSDNEDLDN